MTISETHPAPSPSLLGDYLNFLRHPTFDSTPGPAKKVFIKIWRLYAVHIILILLMAAGIQLLSQWMISIEDHKLGDLLEATPIYQFLFLAVVLAPITEEIIFRLPLRFSPLNFLIPITLILVPIGSSIMQGANDQTLTIVGVWLFVGGLIYLVWTGLNRIPKRTGVQFFSRHLLKLVYGSSIVFGLLHLPNYPTQAWIAAPILVLPQSILGLLLAYIRIRFGFVWAMFTHSFHNFLASSPILLMAFGSSQLRQKLLNKANDIELLPRDQWLQGVFMIAMLGVSVIVIITVVRLFQEWRLDQSRG